MLINNTCTSIFKVAIVHLRLAVSDELVDLNSPLFHIEVNQSST